MSEKGLTPRVRGFIEWELEHYHEERRQHTSWQAARGNLPPTVTTPYMEQTIRVCDAIRRVLDHHDGIDRQLVRILYWDRSHNVTGAGLEVGLSKSQAYNRVNRILKEIAQELGYVTM